MKQNTRDEEVLLNFQIKNTKYIFTKPNECVHRITEIRFFASASKPNQMTVWMTGMEVCVIKCLKYK